MIRTQKITPAVIILSWTLSFVTVAQESQLPTATNGRVTLLGKVKTPGTFIQDLWGYVDPQTGKEYALIGSNAGLTIVDVSLPTNPVQVAHVSNAPGFDIKVWQHYAYSVTGGSGQGAAIVDLSDPTRPVRVKSIASAHNIFISHNGYLYYESPDLRIYDLNGDPLSPELIWVGNFGGHDAAIIGNLLYDFHGSSGTYIFEVSNPAAPQPLSAIQDPTITYHHSGWPTPDGRYLFICDELSSHPYADFSVYDISDLDVPQVVGRFGDPNATIHNLYVIGNYAYTSYYSAGFRVFDISDPARPVIAAEYDTSPTSGQGFSGAFGVYPFAPSGNIYVSDWDNGLFVFDFDPGTPTTVSESTSQPPQRFHLEQNYPNPFSMASVRQNSATVIRYELSEPGHVSLKVYDHLGREMQTLVESEQSAGLYQAAWRGRNREGNPVAAGVYFYRMVAGEIAMTRKMVVVE